MHKPNAHNFADRFWSSIRLWCGLGLLAAICLFWSPFALILFAFDRSGKHQKIGRSIIRIGFSFYLNVLRNLGLIKLSIEDWECITSSPPSIIAPNHPGLLDAVILLTLLPNATCILKSSLLNHPLFGAGARLAGYIPNNRTHEMIRQAVKALNTGQHVLMFPEGTRTEKRPVSPLKVSPFLIAWRARAPIQTILIRSPSGFLGKESPLLSPPEFPIVMSITPGKTFIPEKNVRFIAQEVEDYFRYTL